MAEIFNRSRWAALGATFIILAAVQAQGGYDDNDWTPAAQGKWTVLDGGSCKVIINNGSMNALNASATADEDGISQLLSVKYTGGCKNGLADGYGELKFVFSFDGDTFGTALSRLTDDIWRGQFRDGMLDGTMDTWVHGVGDFSKPSDPPTPITFTQGCDYRFDKRRACKPADGKALAAKFVAGSPVPPRPASPVPPPSVVQSKAIDAVGNSLFTALGNRGSTTGNDTADIVVNSLRLALSSGDGGAAINGNQALLDSILASVRTEMVKSSGSSNAQIYDLVMGLVKQAIASPAPGGAPATVPAPAQAAAPAIYRSALSPAKISEIEFGACATLRQSAATALSNFGIQFTQVYPELMKEMPLEMSAADIQKVIDEYEGYLKFRDDLSGPTNDFKLCMLRNKLNAGYGLTGGGSPPR